MNSFRKLACVMFLVPLLMSGNSIAQDEKSGTLVIDETQLMVIVGGDWGGGTLLLADKSYSFKTGGLKIGGLGAHKIHMVGDVYHLNDVADFPGIYFAAQAGVTVGEAGKQGMWLENSNGVTLHLKSSDESGLALSVGVEGFKITME